MKTKSTILKDILVWLSNRLCIELENNPYDINDHKRYYATYIKECKEILLDLEDQDSVFHDISQNNAIEIVANSIYQNYPNIKCMTACDKSQIYNTLKNKITEFFANNEQVTANPVVDITITDTTD